MRMRVFADTRPLQVPAYRRLWIANIATVIGGQLTVVAIPAQIYSMTGSSAYVGLTGLFGLVPLIIFGLYGGAISDAFDKRRVLMVTTAGMMACALIFWAIAFSGSRNVWLLLGAFALQQGFFAVNQPTRIAIFPRIVPAGQLAAAASLNGTLQQFGAVVGPLVAGALIPFIGYTWLYFLDALAILSSFWAVFALPALPAVGRAHDQSVSRRLVEGFRYILTQPILLASFAADLVAMIFGMPRALYPEIAHVNFGGPEDGGTAMSLLYSAMAIGAIVGGLLSGWTSHVRHDGRVVVWAIAAWGAAIALGGYFVTLCDGAMGFYGSMVILMIMVGGMTDMWSAACRGAILSQSANAEVQGRIQGVHIIVIAGGPRLADMLHGWLSGYWGPGATMAWGGVATVIGIGLLALAIPALRTYTRPTS
ncbi:MAG: MFS transporter [Corynebacterium sp.]|nr:MFS transporter [Corynebacterium sp.]